MKSQFGWIKISGKKYKKDIVIHTDGSVTKREKKKSKALKPDYGHTPLSDSELDFLSEEKPEVVYIGIGHQSSLPITPEARNILKEYETVILPTNEITEKIDRNDRRMVALLHVTC